MSIEKSAENDPLFTLGEYDILDLETTANDNQIKFSFVLDGPRTPTPERMNFAELMSQSGGWKTLKEKKWINDNLEGLFAVTQEREAKTNPDGTFTLIFTYSRSN